MIEIHGHRGFSELYPENTMLSFQKAYENGANAIETDVRMTQDGKFILIHDDSVDRTTNGTGYVSNLTYEYVSSLDAGSWFNSDFSNREDCKIPVLTDLLDAFKDKNTKLALHLYCGIENVQKVINEIESRSMISKVIIFGDIDIINKVREYNNEVFTMNGGMATISNYETILQNAITNNHNAVSISIWNTDEEFEIMTSKIKSANKKVHVSYISSNYELNMQKVQKFNCDYVLGNNPIEMKKYIIDDDDIIEYANKLIKSNIFINGKYGKVKSNAFLFKNNKLKKVKSYSAIK